VCLVVGNTPRALYMLSKCSTTELHPLSKLTLFQSPPIILLYAQT
jgi:hypothetical protein